MQTKSYVDMSDNIERRLIEHNTGKTKTTKYGGPWKVLHFEKLESIEEARNREKYYKSGAGRIKIKNELWPKNNSA